MSARLSTALSASASAAALEISDGAGSSQQPTSPSVAILGEQSVFAEIARADAKELTTSLDATIASTQAWRQQQQEKFEKMRAEALAALSTSVEPSVEPEPDESPPVPRFQPRQQRRPLVPVAEDNDENALGVATAPVPRAPHRTTLSLAALDENLAAVAEQQQQQQPASSGTKASSTTIIDAGERLASLQKELDEMESAHNDLLQYSSGLDDIVKALSALERR